MTEAPTTTGLIWLRALDRQQAVEKADVLIDALPWLKQFHDRTIVVKFGGNAMTDAAQLDSFADDIVYLRLAGIHPVVVHGGGPQISAALAARGIRSEFRGGYRVTTPEAIEVVHDVLTGEVRSSLLHAIDRHGDLDPRGVLAVGLSGLDASTAGSPLFRGRRRGAIVDGVEVDLGLVGEITGVDPQVVLDVLAAGRIPVVSSLATGEGGEVLNVNADAAAAALAVALQAAKLVVLTDVEGLYANWPDRSSLISGIDTVELRALLPRLESGMIPKMTACLVAVEHGVAKAAIVDGRLDHSVLLEIFTRSGVGTEVVPADEPRQEAAP